MAVSAFPSTEESPDLTLLNVARLFTRLEHNLLSPGSELRTLRKSELQRLRVAKVWVDSRSHLIAISHEYTYAR
jgi:hypothetical protein